MTCSIRRHRWVTASPPTRLALPTSPSYPSKFALFQRLCVSHTPLGQPFPRIRLLDSRSTEGPLQRQACYPHSMRALLQSSRLSSIVPSIAGSALYRGSSRGVVTRLSVGWHRRLLTMAVLALSACGENVAAVSPAEIAPSVPTERSAEAPPGDTPQAPAPAEAARTFRIESGMLVVPQGLAYAAGGSDITEGDQTLAHVKAFLDARADVSLLRIEVHSDKTGRADERQKLTEKRALAVALRLVEKGVDCKRIVAVGFGGEKPVADESTPGGRAQNRRTSFAVAMLRGRAIGGMPTDGGGNPAGDPCGR